MFEFNNKLELDVISILQNFQKSLNLKWSLLRQKQNHMDVKVLIQETITVEGITAVMTMEITAEVETVVVEEIQDAVAVATEAAVAVEEILDAAAVAAMVAVEEILDAAAVAAIAAVEEEILDAAAVAAIAAAEEEILDAAAVAAIAAAEEEILDAAAVAAIAAAVATVAVETAEEILTMEDTVVVIEIRTKVVTMEEIPDVMVEEILDAMVEEILDVMVEEIPAVAETEVETKMVDPIPIKGIKRLSRTTESLLKQNRISLVPTRNQVTVAIVEKQKVELTPQRILKRRDSWVGEDHSPVINCATGQSTHAKAAVAEKLLVSVTSIQKKMIESNSL